MAKPNRVVSLGVDTTMPTRPSEKEVAEAVEVPTMGEVVRPPPEAMKVQLPLKVPAVNAAWLLLSESKPVGFKAVRKHAKCFEALQNSCANCLGADRRNWAFKEGTWLLTPDQLEYVLDLLTKRLEAPVDGGLCQGYCELHETLEAACPE